MTQKRLLLVYHFFHPDEVVSARQFTDLALEQQARGFEVTVLTSNRVRGDPKQKLPSEERWRGIRIVRLHRPAWRQTQPVERLASSAWMIGGWFARAATLGPFDAVVVGSDPAFAPLLVVGLRLIWPKATLAHWCFDMWPEAIVAEGVGGPLVLGALAPVATQLMKLAYRACDHVVDLGPRMRERIDAYGGHALPKTLVPWPLVERPPPSEAPQVARVRRELFGDEARLCLLYSGTLARAHDFETILAVARACRKRSGGAIGFSFACRGARLEELQRALTPEDTNVTLAGFCSEDDLAARLEAADMHVLSLREGWSGIVVPSKFFASLAIAKPVFYAGEHISDVGRWVVEHDVGIVARRETADEIASALAALLADRAPLARWGANALRAYDAHFSKRSVNDAWAMLLGQAAPEP